MTLSSRHRTQQTTVINFSFQKCFVNFEFINFRKECFDWLKFLPMTSLEIAFNTMMLCIIGRWGCPLTCMTSQVDLSGEKCDGPRFVSREQNYNCRFDFIFDWTKLTHLKRFVHLVRLQAKSRWWWCSQRLWTCSLWSAKCRLRRRTKKSEVNSKNKCLHLIYSQWLAFTTMDCSLLTGAERCWRELGELADNEGKLLF